MPRQRSEKEVDELIALARTYCELRARLNDAPAATSTDWPADERLRAQLAQLDEKITLLKSNSELDRKKARTIHNTNTNIVQLHRTRRAAR